MKLYVMVGAGGTGSYTLPMLLEKLESQEDTAILVVDGDIVEDKNLTRQGFFQPDVGKNKAEALVSHYNKKQYTTKIIYSPQYITSITHLINLVMIVASFLGSSGTSLESIVLISCVDNNMVRYRLELGQYELLKQGVPHVRYIDAGNAEFYGQVLVNDHSKDQVDLTGDDIKILDGTTDSLYARTPGEFIDKLTYADFELSCDDVSESAPQNILTNQFSAFQIIQALEDDTPMYFNSKTATSNVMDNISIEEVEDELKVMLGQDLYINEMAAYTDKLEIKF